MRIEEVQDGNFQKVPDLLEKKIIKILNDFFITSPEQLENSKEGITIEVQRRLTPIIKKIAESIIISQSADLFKDQLINKIDEILPQIVNKITDSLYKNGISIKRKIITPVIEDQANFIEVPNDVNLKSTDIIDIFINGQLQYKDTNYAVTEANGKIISFDFSPTELSKNDKIIIIKFFI